MGSKICPRCGGPATAESETWVRSDRGFTRSLLCASCGARFDERADLGPVGGTGGPGRGLCLFPLALFVLWIVLRLVPYSDRAGLYAAVAAALEAFRHPVWAAVLAAAVALALVWSRGRGAVSPVRRATLAPDVYVREEGDGRLAIVVSASLGGAARDFVFDRRQGDEERVLTRLRDIGARSAAFATGGGPPSGGPRALATDVQREVHALGVALGDVLLGTDPEIRSLLFDLPGDHLLLRIQPGLAHLPWELVVGRPGSQFLWQHYHVARQVREEAGARPPRGPTPGPLRMLLLADLEAAVSGRALPAAEAEAAEIMELGARWPNRLRVVRRTPRSKEDLITFLAEGYDVVHFAGHSDQRRAGWVLCGGDVIDPGEVVEAAGATPVLVFANACRSGPGAGRSAWSGDAAARLLRAGVAAYVGTIWELDDPGSADFARVFYRAALSGATVGEAATAARSALLGVRPFTWANYAVYGDPTLALVPPTREECRVSKRQV